ncbi:hypothetical protein C2E23DRAFT_826476 [Lenzites betulinus]|nr:hypothetical protein C2E23DRAFT_826476 [Lenzites betulinus]
MGTLPSRPPLPRLLHLDGHFALLLLGLINGKCNIPSPFPLPLLCEQDVSPRTRRGFVHSPHPPSRAGYQPTNATPTRISASWVRSLAPPPLLCLRDIGPQTHLRCTDGHHGSAHLQPAIQTPASPLQGAGSGGNAI